MRPDGMREPSEVAIRVADRADDPTSTEAIRLEMELLRSLDSPRIPKVHAYYPGQAALAVSWVSGVNLADLLSAARSRWIQLDPATALDIAIEVAGTLRAAHAVVFHGRPIVHGHLGPQRVRIDERGLVTVVGFGITPAGHHPAYTPPEQAARGPLDPRADQWALGAMLVEMLLQRRLYDSDPDALVASLEGRVGPWVAEIETRWPPAGRVVRKMLATAPEERYATDGELVGALLTASREVGGVSSRGGLVASVQRQRQILAAASEPMPAPVLKISLTPAEDDTSEDSDELPARPTAVPDDSDPFPDSPTSPDGYRQLSDVLFQDEPTDPGTREVADDEPGELASTDGGPRTAERRGKLEGSEWAGVGLAIVLAGVALVAILTWLL